MDVRDEERMADADLRERVMTETFLLRHSGSVALLYQHRRARGVDGLHMLLHEAGD